MDIILYTLVMVQITIACVTLYLHRGQTHKAVTFHPAVNHFMRFWLWLTTGMVTKQWVAIHRRHHQKSDQEVIHTARRFMVFGVCCLAAHSYIMMPAKIQPWSNR